VKVNVLTFVALILEWTERDLNSFGFKPKIKRDKPIDLRRSSNFIHFSISTLPLLFFHKKGAQQHGL
jgi:hypothetical protein